MGVPSAIGSTKSAEKYLGQSTVAGLPDPTTVPAGGYYEMTDAGLAYTITWAIGDKAISNGTSYAKKLVPVAKVVDGGTGANNAASAALPENLNLYPREDVDDRHLSKAAENGVVLSNNGYLLQSLALDATTLNDNFTLALRVRFPQPPSVAAIVAMLTEGDTSAGNYASLSYEQDGTIDIVHNDGAAKSVNDVLSGPVTPGLIYSIILRQESTGNGFEVFFGGISKASVASGPNTSTSGRWCLGADNTPGAGIEILEAVPYNMPLSDAAIAEIAKRPGVVPLEYQWGQTPFYESDFGSDSLDGWAFDQGNNPTSDATANLGGDVDNLKFVAGNTTGQSRMWKAVATSSIYGKRVLITGEYWLPAGQTYVDGFRFGLNVSDTVGSYHNFTGLTTGAWTKFRAIIGPIASGNSTSFFRLLDGGSTTIDVAAEGEFVAFRNLKQQQVGAIASYQGRNVQSDGGIVDESSNAINLVPTSVSRLFDPNPQSDGIWTPTIEFGGASVGVVYSEQLGTYTQIGPGVFYVTGRISLTSKGTSVGAATIAGCPITARAGTDTPVYHAKAINMSGGIGVDCTGVSLSSTIKLFFIGGGTQIQEANVINTTILQFAGVVKGTL